MDSEKHRRLLRERKMRLQARRVTQPMQRVDGVAQRSWVAHNVFDRIYHDHYKALFLITIALLLFSLITIGVTYAKTGDVIHKGVSLSGGLTLTVPTDGKTLDTDEVMSRLASLLPSADISVREIGELGRQTALTIEVSTPENTPQSLESAQRVILAELENDLPGVTGKASAEIVGPSLGDAFFQQTAKAVLVAFVLMGLVIFLYFGETIAQKAIVAALSVLEGLLIWYAGGWLTIIAALLVGAFLAVMYVRYSVPSAGIILAAFSTIIFTIAVTDLMGLRISTAGIAAFLMLIGYSVDTDVLLSSRVLKRGGGTVYERVVSTVKTGLTMTGTTMAASLVALIFTKSAVIREIMLIIVIGLVADIFYTWIQNAGLLRLYLEHKEKEARR